MTNNYFRYYKPNFLKTMIVLLGISLFLGNRYISTHWGVSVSIFAVISLIFVAFDKFLWKYKPFSWLFWIPNISGRYEGFLEFEFRNEKCEPVKGKLPHVKVIHQTGSTIVINSFTKKTDGTPSSPSVSIDVSVIKEKDDTYSLIYSYLNNGSGAQGFSPHYGTEIIKIIQKGKKKILTGKYYTDRLPYQTRGEFVDLEYKNGSLYHEF